MQCFEAVRVALDGLWKCMDGDEPSKYKRVAETLESMREKYISMMRNGVAPDFSKSETRAAYVYRYVSAHANFLCQEIEKSKDLKSLFGGPKVRMAAIGGGPGSDLVGVLKHIESRGASKTKIFCEIADGCQSWQHTWAGIGFEMELPCAVNSSYLHHNVLNPETWVGIDRFNEADSFSLMFFLSEVYPHRKEASKYFREHVFGRAKKGAMVLFIDNRDNRLSGWFDELMQDTGFDVIYQNADSAKIEDEMEDATELACYTEELQPFLKEDKGQAKKNGQIAVRIARKR